MAVPDRMTPRNLYLYLVCLIMLLVGIFAATMTLLIGITMGLLAGFLGGWVDRVIGHRAQPLSLVLDGGGRVVRGSGAALGGRGALLIAGGGGLLGTHLGTLGRGRRLRHGASRGG